MTSVEFRQVRHRFGETNALTDMDLRIDSGQYVVLFGESGCGKTTALRIGAGLLNPTSGSVWMDEQCVDPVAPRNRPLAMVFQHSALYPHKTAGDNIRFGLPKNAGNDHVDTAIAFAGVGDWVDRYPNQLSGGQLRRVAIAKAIAGGQPIRLLDEPLSALDLTARWQLERDLVHLHQAIGGTTIHVTHDWGEATRVADKVAVMRSGRILQFDSPAKIYRQPNSVQVASCIGTSPINLIPATFHDGTIASLQEDIFFRGDWSTFANGFIARPEAITIGVRPDDLHPADAVQADGQPRLCIASSTGESKLTGQTVQWNWNMGAKTVRAIVNESLHVNAATTFCAGLDQLLFFDSATGKLIGRADQS